MEVTVKVKFNETDQASENELKSEKSKKFDFAKNTQIAPKTANGYVWFRGDLHLHTFHSDGNWTV